jgi:hypothetical protein
VRGQLQRPTDPEVLLGAGPGRTNVKAAKECSTSQYKIQIVPLANSADASRELLVRRLAAHDGDIDMIQMDTIWTPSSPQPAG